MKQVRTQTHAQVSRGIAEFQGAKQIDRLPATSKAVRSPGQPYRRR